MQKTPPKFIGGVFLLEISRCINSVNQLFKEVYRA